MSMTYNVRSARGVTVVGLCGRITLNTQAAAVKGGVAVHQLVRDLTNAGHRNILFNLRDVTFIDSSGISELFASFTTVRDAGGVLKISGPSERVHNALRLTKLNTVIDVFEDEGAAVQSFAGTKEHGESAA